MDESMKKTAIMVAVALIVLAGSAFADPAGERIARAYYDLKPADDTSARITMVLIDSAGVRRTRSLQMFTKISSGQTASFIEFISPADVAGTRFLTVTKTGGESDQRLWLPALKKSRKIAATATDGDFVGSDLSYYDMQSHRFEDYGYELLSSGETIADAAFAGMTFSKVEMKPKDPAAPYGKSVGYFNEANHFLYRIVTYGKDGAMWKTISMVKVEAISGILTPIQTLVTNHKKGTQTLLQFSDLKANSGLSDNIFTVQNLER
jgi:outer membrane lipoprotein-sorting protein